MDDAFRLIASEMPPRRLSPVGIRIAVSSIVAIALIVSFAMFVTGQQRAADERRSAAIATQAATRRAEAQAAAQAEATSSTAIELKCGSRRLGLPPRVGCSRADDLRDGERRGA